MVAVLDRAQKIWESSVSGPPVPAPKGEKSVMSVGSMWSIPLAIAPVIAMALFWRTWQQLFAFDKGLDSTMPGFNEYWLSIFGFNMFGLPLIAASIFAAIIITGIKASATPLTPHEEMKRHWRLMLGMAAFAIASFFGAHFGEEDGAWHQVTLRDTAFTPSHVALFYGSFPMMFYVIFGVYLYGRTRLPHMWGGKAVPLGFAIVIGGTTLLVFQVAFNEFGHTYWQTEEVFSAPLHWPFVFFAWMLIGVAAIWLPTLLRVTQLVKNEVLANEAANEDEQWHGITAQLSKPAGGEQSA
ncbi:methane monooxygenase/ammonia monooxygenase subunit C [Smaragdicoccus niigatensis]|uniref:methane monooxygenase/ammonia monooxygenase subunit C n=1 Tax=Smaragdicoccus niigatensis TaxID=359359 RepID=UPI00037963D7|nr:methane monooxygenase/ammonia monooxygenase subunit C [Smaragdicoccus niigatensis]